MQILSWVERQRALKPVGPSRGLDCQYSSLKPRQWTKIVTLRAWRHLGGVVSAGSFQKGATLVPRNEPYLHRMPCFEGRMVGGLDAGLLE